MTTAETMEELTRRGQEAFESAWKIWADTWRPFVALLPAPDGKVPSAEEFVDKAYDFAEQALEHQRDFTKKMLGVTRSATNRTAWATQDATRTAAPKTGTANS